MPTYEIREKETSRCGMNVQRNNFKKYSIQVAEDRFDILQWYSIAADRESAAVGVYIEQEQGDISGRD